MAAALTKREIARLHQLGAKVETHRRKRRKQALQCVVVESDWPEFEPTWRAIETRVRTEAAASYSALGEGRHIVGY